MSVLAERARQRLDRVRNRADNVMFIGLFGGVLHSMYVDHWWPMAVWGGAAMVVIFCVLYAPALLPALAWGVLLGGLLVGSVHLVGFAIAYILGDIVGKALLEAFPTPNGALEPKGAAGGRGRAGRRRTVWGLPGGRDYFGGDAA